MHSSNKNKNSAEGTIIGTGVKLIGSLTDEGPITINGEVRGDIKSDIAILVGETAHITGPILAKEVIVCGTVEGEIIAEDNLEIAPTGIVNGKIETGTLIIKPGAHFNGQCKMSDSHMQKQDIEPELDS